MTRVLVLGAGVSGGSLLTLSALGALSALERTRPVIGAFSLGIGRAAFEYALD